MLFLFSKALLRINLGVAYAACIGVGIPATFIISAIAFRQGVSLPGGVGIVLIIAGCLLLNLLGSVHPPNSPDILSGLFGEI